MLRDFFRNDKPMPIDSLIDAVQEEMHTVGVNSAEYPDLLSKLERLNEIKAKQRRPPVSRDTIAIVLGGIVQVVIIVAYERTHVVTTKAINHVIRQK